MKRPDLRTRIGIQDELHRLYAAVQRMDPAELDTRLKVLTVALKANVLFQRYFVTGFSDLPTFPQAIFATLRHRSKHVGESRNRSIADAQSADLSGRSGRRADARPRPVEKLSCPKSTRGGRFFQVPERACICAQAIRWPPVAALLIQDRPSLSSRSTPWPDK